MLPGFFDDRTTGSLTEWAEQVIALPEGPGGCLVYREPSIDNPNTTDIQRIEDISPRHPQFDQFLHSAPLLTAVSQVLGGAACLFKDEINIKMPGVAGFPRHQDHQTGWSPYAPMFVTALVCLDAATPENGCLEMSGAPRLTELVTPEQRQTYELTLAPMKPGDVLLFDSFVIHTADGNHTQAKRRLLYFAYNLQDNGDQREKYYADRRKNFPR